MFSKNKRAVAKNDQKALAKNDFFSKFKIAIFPAGCAAGFGVSKKNHGQFRSKSIFEIMETSREFAKMCHKFHIGKRPTLIIFHKIV